MNTVGHREDCSSKNFTETTSVGEFQEQKYLKEENVMFNLEGKIM